MDKTQYDDLNIVLSCLVQKVVSPSSAGDGLYRQAVVTYDVKTQTARMTLPKIEDTMQLEGP